jgi:hypothetical protein
VKQTRIVFTNPSTEILRKKCFKLCHYVNPESGWITQGIQPEVLAVSHGNSMFCAMTKRVLLL